MKYSVGDLTIDTGRQLVFRAVDPIALPKLSYDLLLALMRAAPNLVSLDELMQLVWPGIIVSPETVSQRVKLLRDALGDDPRAPRYIGGLRGRGYRIVALIKEIDDNPANASEPDPTAARSPAPVPAVSTPGRQIPTAISGWGAVSMLAIGLIAAVAWLFVQEKVSAPPSTGRSTQPLATQPAEPAFLPPLYSVAVLPFVNMSGDADEEYFADGISEQLLNTLSRIDELQVAGQTSSFSFKGKDVALATVARKLNVSTILEGSVRRSGQTVRITAQLINSTTGFQLWSQTYDRSIRDTLTVQSEIADSVAHALKITLLGRVAELAAEGGTHDERALDAYLRSMKLEGTVRSAEEARATIEAYSEALRFDPHFALAYSARARAELNYAGYFMNEATRATFERARADAERAVAIAPDLGETHSALGETLEVGFLDFGRAAEEHSRALTLAPGSAQVLRAYSRFMAYMGHAEAAITAARRNAALDSLNVVAYRVLGEALQAARRYPEAIAAYDQAIRLNSAHATEVYQGRGRSEYLLGNFEMAKTSCEVEPDQYHVQLCMPLVYEKLGQHAAAQAVLTTAMAAQGDAAAYQYAQIYAQWRDTEKALDWLEKALRLQDPGIEGLKTDELLDPLRALPRFQAIERALKFAT